MNNIIIKIIGIIIVVSMLVPVTVGLKCEIDNVTVSKTNDGNYLICILLWKVDDNGHLIYNITNFGNDVNNETILVYFYGSSVFTKLNQVDVHTEIFIQHLSNGESELFKTEDQVFKVRPLLRKPLIIIYVGEMELIFSGYILKSHIKIILQRNIMQYDY